MFRRYSKDRAAVESQLNSSLSVREDVCIVANAVEMAHAHAICPLVRELTGVTSKATIALPWSAFAGGSPSATVDPSELVLIRWDFEWADGISPYVTLDNVMLFD